MTEHDESALDRAARIAAGDDGTYYDRTAAMLHWATAALVVIQFALAQLWELVPRPQHHLMVVAHMSFGILLAIIIAWRIVWRLIPGHQVPAIGSGWSVLAAKAVHFLLYAMLVAEAVLGFLLRWSGGEAMSFFGLLLPPPFAAFPKATNELIGELHELNGWAIIVVALGHAAAALYHHVVLKDRVLIRMMPHRAARG